MVEFRVEYYAHIIVVYQVMCSDEKFIKLPKNGRFYNDFDSSSANRGAKFTYLSASSYL